MMPPSPSDLAPGLPSDPPSGSSNPRDARRRVRRAVLVFALVLALHWLAAQWLVRLREPFKPASPADVPVQIELLKPQRIEREPEPPKAAPAPPRAAPKPAAPAAAPHRSEPVLTSPAASPDARHAAPAPQTADAAQPSPASASGVPDAARAPGADAPRGPASKGVKFSPPPSGELRYDTFYNGMQNMGGTIHWETDGSTYSLFVSMPLPFVGPYTYESRGRIDAFGIAPERYVETRGRRPSDFAIFNRDTKQIVFTSTPNSVSLPDGAQDRFSLLMELAGLVRGDPDAYRPGLTREFFVVDRNSGETWPITTIGDETISTNAGMLATRHFMRLPRHAGDTRRIDIWLAPSLGWLPARMVQTEPNGSQIELLWHSATSHASESTDTNEPPAPASSPPNTNANANAAKSVNSTDATPAAPAAASAADPS
ncbi:Putative PROLIN-rich signal peptide protein [Burkholderia singularis]|uniref:Putative PROLIN-rich signal peptide protein n=2 Tax=Burkholderia singularis TaxID=1503053 RepID=A0A238H4W4_9BURK|nr:Putative PROLIN-rich signal peptide protein [Burkholderia singularis]